MKSVELFAGAGGLAMGCEIAGFEHLAVVEWDKWACDTVRENQKHGFPLLCNWDLFEGDVRAFDWSQIPKDIDLLAGGLLVSHSQLVVNTKLTLTREICFLRQQKPSDKFALSPSSSRM